MNIKFFLSLGAALLFSRYLVAQEIVQAQLAERLKQHVAFLASDSLEGRGLGTQGKVLAMNYIAQEFESIGLESFNDSGYIQHLVLPLYNARIDAANVIGFITGSDTALKDEYIVIGAHYDHLGYHEKKDGREIFHGADDNASGVAAVIELARYFSMNRNLLKRSIVLAAFDAEESGLWGSSMFFKDTSRVKLSQVMAMFSLDMIGMYQDNKGLILEGMGTLNDGEDLARSVAEKRNFTLKRATADVAPRTDTWPFIQRGVPAVHAFTGTKSPYHKSEDTYEKLDYEGLALITEYLQELITGLAGMPEINPSGRYARMQKPFGLSFDGGITAGAGISRHKTPEEYFTPKGIFTYNAGLFMQINIGRRITFQPEVLFQGDGSKSPEGTFRRQSIIVPVNLHVIIAQEDYGLFRFYPFAGGYYLFCLNGKDGEDEIDLEESYSREEWGLNLGLGMDIMDWQVKWTWRRSLTNLLQNSGDEIYPSLWFFSVGYKF